jgi:antitoxin component YwqK of YwqJK toxin-antitoxin module
MKKLLFILCCFSFVSVFAQDYSFVNGDPKFMVPNPIADDRRPELDKYVLKPDLPDGTYSIFFDKEKTKIIQKGFLQNGHRVKYWAYYTEEQNPKMEIEYDELGIISGLVKQYYPGGALMTETQFRNGMANGMMVSYHESGVKKMQCNMKDNNLVGQAIYYDQTGKVTQAMEYKYEGK